MEKTVTERVNEFREQVGLSITAMAKALNIGQTTLNKQLKDDGYGVSLSTILLILQTYPELSAEWLLRGVGSSKLTTRQTQTSDKDLIDALRDHIATLKREVEELRREKSLSVGGYHSMVAEEQAPYVTK